MKKTVFQTVIVAIMIFVMVAPTAFAYETWANVFGGWMDTDWFNTNNWTYATVPDYNDSTPYSVTCIDGGVSCVISAGTNASFYKMRTPYSLGTTGVGTATLTIQAGATLQGRSYMDMAFSPGDTAIINADQATVSLISELKCGIKGDAFLALQSSNMSVGSYVVVAKDAGSHGTLNITNSTLNISNSYLSIGVNADSSGTVEIAGDDSTIYAKSYLTIGQNGSGTLNLGAGTLTTDGTISVNSSSTGQGGTLNISGGTLTGLDTNVGPNSSINMTGGQLNVNGRLRIWGTTNGQIDLHGGTAICNTFLLVAPLVDIDGEGSLVINNDSFNLVKGYIDSGWITGGGVARKVAVVYDSNANTTTLTLGTADLTQKAYAPVPARDAENVSRASSLQWQAGDGAVNHMLYLSMNYEQVANAAIPAMYVGTSTEYTPATLESGVVYYWRVDEFDGTKTTAGEVWSFTTGGLAMIDNFNTYSDTTDLLSTWTAGSGATMTLLAGGSATDFNAAVTFDNSTSPYYAQVVRAVPFADFTASGMKALDIWYRGSDTNYAAPIFITLSDGANSATVITADMEASKKINIVWHIALSEFTAANPAINLTSIDTIAIGVGDKLNPAAGGTGSVEFDDIALYENRCFTAPGADLTGDCIVDIADIAELAAQWLTSGLWPND